MKKKLFLLLLTIVLTCSITYGEYIYIKNQFADKPEQTVLFISSTVKKGHLMTESDVIVKVLKVKDIELAYITDISKVIGRYANKDISSGAILLNSHITPVEQLNFARDDDYIWITFEFGGTTSNGWNLREGQIVKLLYNPKDGSDYTVYEEVIIKRIYDKNIDESSQVTKEELKFVTFEIDTLKGYELIAKRDAGRVEIIIL